VPGGWFDLHLHTAVGSDDSRLDAQKAAERLRALGFWGFAVTDHQTAPSAAWVREVAARTGMVVLRGAEVSTEIGHVLVYGWDDESLWAYDRIADLARAARAKGAVLVAAHPLRRWYSERARRAGVAPPDLDALARRPWWRWLDGVEAMNGRATASENAAAGALADRLPLMRVGGSDAHATEHAGRAGTWIEVAGRDPEAVLDALRRGRVRPGRPGGGDEETPPDRRGNK
jgi:predicted metal-dependent phosphoesterase TrpH